MLRRVPPDETCGGATGFSPWGLHIKATAESHVFIKNKDIAGLASRVKTPGEALELALPFEKDSVAF